MWKRRHCSNMIVIQTKRCFSIVPAPRTMNLTEMTKWTGEEYAHYIIKIVRIQIKEVTDVMRENVQKVMERGDKMEDLEVASERLTMAGMDFHNSARKAHRRAWVQNMKARIIVGVIVLIIVLSILVLDIMVLYLVIR
ncbi:vesicle-associated membrane protein 2-like isoform X3 [Athalia rosae]|uniref:vesicle-associated membrane protein 2-like isoform X3 n=1 Tax=Athalia rosae TaxID=37344 RepID=UPI0020342A03|nr:vesicle-associated membrane protein 2-like isoform X3 [Athalia rosae]